MKTLLLLTRHLFNKNNKFKEQMKEYTGIKKPSPQKKEDAYKKDSNCTESRSKGMHNDIWEER